MVRTVLQDGCTLYYSQKLRTQEVEKQGQEVLSTPRKKNEKSAR
jgi:hypothetical protein